MLEGYYWPWWLSAPLRERQNRRIDRQTQELAALAAKPARTPREEVRFRVLFERLKYVLSLAPGQRQLTRLGNVLRCYELRPQQKYGLDALHCWPHIWLMLPDTARKELGEARDRLDRDVHLWQWGLLFLVWTPWACWAAALSLVLMLSAWRRLEEAADVYGRLLETVFDLYRWDLYRALHLTPPEEIAKEAALGTQVTAYLKGEKFEFASLRFKK
jgi:hypothetical protein